MLCYCYAILTMLCYVMLCYAIAMLCYAMPCHAMLCRAVLCCVVPCHAMPCYAMLCYTLLRYAMLLYPTLCAKVCYEMLYGTILWYAMFCCTNLGYDKICYFTPFYLVLRNLPPKNDGDNNQKYERKKRSQDNFDCYRDFFTLSRYHRWWSSLCGKISKHQ